MYYIPLKAMPVAIFFSSVINLLYYFGVLQYFLLKVSWFIHIVMQTSPTESVVNIMNIFVGMVN
jgi:pyrimidine nucleoside transport protein